MTTHLISYVHSGLSHIREIALYFSPLKIYVPWGGTVPEHDDGTEIIASYPPEELKPDADMESILNECFNWANEQGETSRREIIKTGHINPTSDESLRHIKTILTSRISSDTRERDNIIKWHILLHLANRLEENRKEANRMLEGLNKKPSPLLNNADLTEKTKYPLENLTGIDAELLLSDSNTKQLLKAWYGLFKSYIEKGDFLLTLDRPTFEHLFQEWDLLDGNNSLKTPGIISFKMPIVKRPAGNNAETINKISIGDDIRNILTSDIKQEDKIVSLKNLTAEFESMFQSKTEDNQILFSILLFQSPENCEGIKNDPFLNFLSGRALIFAEIKA